MLLDDSAWYQALTLRERRDRQCTDNPSSTSERLSRRANRLLALWKEQSPFQDEKWLSLRLALDGLDEEKFLQLLGETPEELRAAFSGNLPWLSNLAEAFAEEADSAGSELAGASSLESSAAFLPLVEPLLGRAIQRLRRGARELADANPTAPFDPGKAAELFYAPVPRRLGAMISQTAVLELFVSKVQGHLEGESAEERFQSFARRLKDRSFALGLLRQYPVLARIVAGWLDLWVHASLELLERFCADWELLLSTFSPTTDPGQLEEVSGGVGDRHRGGRAVLIVRFSSGLRLVYKPKPMAVDVHFGELVDRLNERGAPALRVPRVLDRGEYGWSEFVVAAPCANPEELERFYRRQGAFLALLYVLQATDFHNENLIASGEHPMLVDLESLFHAQVREPDAAQAVSMAEYAMANSVLRIGLLPQRQWSRDKTESIDLSGLGAVNDQVSPWKVPLWEKGGTDEMKLVRRQVKIGAAANRPKLGGETANPLEFSEAILDGFGGMYELLLRHRDELLADDGPLVRFAQDEVRAIFRHTRFYAALLNESYHPDLLRDALERDRIFDRLWFGMDRDPLAEKAVQLIPSEREDLWAGDIPFFSSRVDSRDVWTSRGRRIPDFFRASGLEAVKLRLAALSESDLRQQIWFIRGSMTTLAMDTEPRKKRYALRAPQDGLPGKLREGLLLAASQIGDRLGDLAFRGESDASWIGLKIVGRNWTLTPLGVDLYSGSPGIALFLAYLSRLTGRERYDRLAEAAMAGVLRQDERLRASLKSVGGFEGWAGLLHACLHLAVLWPHSDFLTRAEEIVPLLAEHAEVDEALDVIGGSAGALIVLLGFHRATGSGAALDSARRMGERLLAKSHPAEAGLAWTVSVNPDRPLTGFSHGAAGISWALLELYGATQDGRFKEAALQALEFERSLFDPEVDNWPDLRAVPSTERTSSKCMTAWCHGAPGIGLGRLRMLRHLNGEGRDVESDIEAALRSTRTRGFGINHSLCHGDLGNLELFLEAGRVLQDTRWGNEANILAVQILETIREHGWVCGVPLGVETPGLMNGLAGIGYGLLRMAAPDEVPSVLLLDPPSLPMP